MSLAADRDAIAQQESGTRRRRAAALPPDARRSMIMDAAVPLILARGELVTTQEIARAAGIAEGTIFRVFETKDALVEAVIDRAMDPVPLEAAIRSVDPALALEAAVSEVVSILQKRVLEAWRLLSSVGPRFHRGPRRHPFDSPALTTLFEAHGSGLEVKPQEAARHLRALTFAMTHPMLTARPALPSDVAHRFLHGVAKSC
jgi:AcrR family transcriptional regulator